MTTSSRAPVDVFILGTVFSGSTLIGNALGTHPDAFFAGELASLPAYAEAHKVMDPMPGCLACELLQKPCEVWTKERIARVEQAGPGRCLAELRLDTNKRVIVEGSKLAGWFRVVDQHDGVDRDRTRVIVTSKDPFAFADSIMRRSQGPAWHAANIWRDTYFDLLRTLNASRLFYTHVSYGEFCADPEGALKRLCRLSDLDYTPELLRFREKSVCSVGGNPGAHVNRAGMLDALAERREWRDHIEPRHWQHYRDHGAAESFQDLKWTERLGPGDLAQIIQTPGLSDLATLLGYDLAGLAVLAQRG